ncbi:MAG TPA: hypothetical protein ENH37_12680 [Deltaproteobacteria bacterium]|nr:hypothetical protein [Deltaproteobacteria bacterium]
MQIPGLRYPAQWSFSSGISVSGRGRVLSLFPYTVFKDNLHAKEVVVGDGARRNRYILCHNPKEAEPQAKHHA